MNRFTWNMAAAGGAVVALIAVAAFLGPEQNAGPCTVAQGPVSIPDVPEASGLAASLRTPGILWSHNDSGNATVLFALDAAGTVRGRVRLPVRARDWEDVSAARCASGDCLFIADIGDNNLARRRVQIYRVPEPRPGDRETDRPDVMNAVYADGAHNSEALVVIGPDVFVITKDRTAGVYRATLPAQGGGDLTLRRVGQLGLEVVTDAEASPDERWVVVRNPREVLIYHAADFIRGGAVRPALRISIDGLREPQGEGVALGNDGTLYLASEGRSWSQAGRLISLRCPLPSPLSPSAAP